MKILYRTTILISLLGIFVNTGYAQGNALAPKDILNIQTSSVKKDGRQKVVIITGNRFSYPLVQKWIDEYNKENPGAQVIIEARGSSDPAQYDILSEVYEQDAVVQKSRSYLHIARYAILPVANSKSSFAKIYAEKGINQELINQLFFHDLYADKKKEQEVKGSYTIYTRLQKAGAPIVFTKYFGYEQKDIKGKAIAGSDEHLLKAILRDSTAVSYLPLTLIYDHNSKQPLNGLVVLPVDLNGNGRISTEEKFYNNLTTVIEQLEDKNYKDIKNIPLVYLHLSIDKNSTNQEAINFMHWVAQNGQTYLHDFGYLQPTQNEGFENEMVGQVTSKRAE